MNFIKVAATAKKEFLEFYDIKKYMAHPSTQLVIKNYNPDNQKIIIGEEK